MQTELSVDFVANQVEEFFSESKKDDTSSVEGKTKIEILMESIEQLTVHQRSILEIRMNLLKAGYSESEALDLQLSITNAVGFKYCQEHDVDPGAIGDFIGLDLQTENVVKLPQRVS